MKKRGTLLLLLGIVMLAFIWGAFLSFNRNLNSHMQQNVDIRLQEITQPNLVSFDMQMEEQIKKVRTFADFLGSSGELGSADHIALLNAAVENNGLLRCAIAFPDGSFVTHDGKNEGNVAEDAFFKANMRGEFFITDPRPAVVDPSKTVILFSAPIHNPQSQITGSIIYSYLCDDLNNIFNLNFLEGQGEMYVAKQTGELLIGKTGFTPGEDNPLTQLRQRCTHLQHSAEGCLALTGEEGSFSLTFQGEDNQILLRYNKLRFNDWYMLSMVPETAATKTISIITADQRSLGLSIALCVLAYLLVLFLLWFSRRFNIDKLTGALTPDSFRRKAKTVLQKREFGNYVFIKLDVKNFKLINRVYDFAMGDQVIKNIAEAIRYVTKGESALYARVGTDDFLLLLPYSERPILDAQRNDFVTKFRELMGPSFTTLVEFPTGQYVLRPEDYPKPDITEILEKVNFAHRAAKHRGQYETIVDYVEDIEQEALMEKSVEDKMSQALTSEEFKLYLQPKFCVKTETICGAEALVRWKVNGQYYMHPTSFIPVLERNGFIVKLDLYMFRQAAQKLREILDDGLQPIPISVNFSRCHLSNQNFVKELCAITDEYAVPRKYLEIELTESAVFEHVEQIQDLSEQLHEAGFTLSMDDFGSGYSCLALLNKLNVDTLKLDKGFFDEKADPTRTRTVVAGVLRMAQQLHITTVAEGVEKRHHVDMLRELGCDIIQGFYFARPLPAEVLKLPNAAEGSPPQ